MSPKSIGRSRVRRLGVKVIEGLTALLILAGGSAPLLGCEDGTACARPGEQSGAGR